MEQATEDTLYATEQESPFFDILFLYFIIKTPHPSPPQVVEGIKNKTPSPAWGRLGWGTVILYKRTFLLQAFPEFLRESRTLKS